MSFNPFKEKGLAPEKQIANWSELNITPYKKEAVHPYTQARVILMNGVEVEAVMFKHQFARQTNNLEILGQLALSRRIEQQQQKRVNWLVPGEASILEATIGYEQLAVDLTAYLAQNVPDPYVKQVFDFGLLEDFDHLYRYANLMECLEGKKAGDIVQGYTDILPGRPTKAEHRFPLDDLRKFADARKANPLTLLYIMTLIAGEQQTMNFYMNMGDRIQDETGRGLYLEIAQIEEQHVTQYESLMDGRLSLLESALLHEYHECWLYHSFMEHEVDDRIKKVWELHLMMEIQHLQTAAHLLQKFEKKDPTELCPSTLPKSLVLESAIEYVRKILDEQVNLTADGTEFEKVDDLPPDHRYFAYQSVVNSGRVPSEDVIEMNKKKNGDDYRVKQAVKK